MKMDSTTAYLLAQTEGSVYKYGAVEAWIVGFLSTFYNILNPLMLYYCIVQFIFNKGTINKKFYYSIILFVFIVLLYNISQGARGGIFISTINLCVVFLPFWKNIQLRIKRKLLKGGILFLVLSGMYTITMTISRFLDNSSKETPLGSFFRYIGEPFPHLGNKFWDQVIIHPLGSRFYPFIFGQHFSEAKYITTNAENQAVWGSITGVPILNYKTIYGDFYIEFGPIIGFIFIIFYAGLFRCFIHRNKISFAMVPLLYYYIDMYVSAPLLFGKWGYANVRELFIIIALYFFMRLFKIGNNYTI